MPKFKYIVNIYGWVEVKNINVVFNVKVKDKLNIKFQGKIWGFVLSLKFEVMLYG